MEGRKSWIPLLWLQQVILLTVVAGYESVYFDKYGHCNRKQGFELAKDTYTLFHKGGGLAHENLFCRIVFKSPPDMGVCLTFHQFLIRDCGVTMDIQSSDTDPDPKETWRKLTCRDRRPNQMCTSSRYVAVTLRKANLNFNKGYEFKIHMESSSSAGEESVLFASIGVFVGVIVGVIVVIVVLSLTVVYCCYKKKKQDDEDDPEEAAQKSLVEPSAPPLSDIEHQHHQPAHMYVSGPISCDSTYPQCPPPPYTPYGAAHSPHIQSCHDSIPNSPDSTHKPSQFPDDEIHEIEAV